MIKYDDKRANLFGKLCAWVGAIRIYVDGDGIDGIWRWWHPVSWVMYFLGILACAYSRDAVQDGFNFRLPEYWAKQRDKVEWI